MDIKQNTNNFSKGMTNIPSDNICPDDSVAAEWNMIFRNREHCPIQQPINMQLFGEASFYVIHIHKVSGKKHYIGINDNGYLVYLAEGQTAITTIGEYNDYTEETQIVSLGNTLVVNIAGKEMRYFLWKFDTSKYLFIGNRMPNPNVTFSLGYSFNGTAITNYTTLARSSGNYSGIINLYRIDNEYAFNHVDEKKADADAFIVGLYEKCKNKVNEKKGFCNPFFIRYALKLYDGSYTKISEPILMFPTVQNNLVFYKGDLVGTNSGDIASAVVLYCKLFYSNMNTFEDWTDIIKSIAVFVTKPVDIVDTGLGIGKYANTASNSLPNKFDTVSKDDIMENSSTLNIFHELVLDYDHIINAYHKKPEADIINELKSSSVFYKLFEIDPEKKTDCKSVDELFRWEDLQNLTTLEQLDHDDYFSKCPIYADNIYIYNKKTHLSNVSRGYYEGANIGCNFMLTDASWLRADVIHIKTTYGIKKILHYAFNSKENPFLYYFYPDTRAFKVDRLCRDDGVWKLITSLTLKPHPMLNGAYYMRNTLPTINDNLSGAIGVSEYKEIEISSSYQSPDFEKLQNEVWVSEVNNPFVFNAQGVNTVGNGSVLGVISNTQAISQGQFGQFPLFCFTTEGVWTLETSSEGTYASAHPISREVCNNKSSITATDNLIFFTSEKGLMMINGAQVSCVSEQLSGKTYNPTQQEISLYTENYIEPDISFLNFIRECKIAYDYRDNLLWITNPNYYQCYILSIESGAFAMTTLPYPISNVINDYPDNIILGHDNDENYYAYSLIGRDNINDDSRRINSFIVSRPMKIGDQNSLKCPTMARLIGNFNDQAAIKLRFLASDDLVNWVKMLSLRGRGFKYFKYNLIFENLLPTDTFSGIAERWQFKYQGKFR